MEIADGFPRMPFQPSGYDLPRKGRFIRPAIRSMIDYKVSLGYEESTYLPRSRSLDRYCMEHFPDETSLTREVVPSFGRRPQV